MVSKLPGRETEAWRFPESGRRGAAIPGPRASLLTRETQVSAAQHGDPGRGGFEVSPKQAALRCEHRPALPASLRGRYPMWVSGVLSCLSLAGFRAPAPQSQSTSRTFSLHHLKVQGLNQKPSSQIISRRYVSYSSSASMRPLMLRGQKPNRSPSLRTHKNHETWRLCCEYVSFAALCDQSSNSGSWTGYFFPLVPKELHLEGNWF